MPPAIIRAGTNIESKGGGEVKNYTYNVLLMPKEQGGYRAHCPALSGCRAYGDTKAEAVENIKISIMHRLEKLKAGRKPIPRDQDLAS